MGRVEIPIRHQVELSVGPPWREDGRWRKGAGGSWWWRRREQTSWKAGTVSAPLPSTGVGQAVGEEEQPVLLELLCTVWGESGALGS